MTVRKRKKKPCLKPVEIAGIKLYSVKDLARAFGLSEATIRHHFKTGKIAGTKIGHTWYVSEDRLRTMFLSGD